LLSLFYCDTEAQLEENPLNRQKSINRSDLIDQVALAQRHLSAADVELAIKSILEIMADSLAAGNRIEIRGVGCFSVRQRTARVGRNPKTGETVAIPSRYAIHFKPGKELRERVNQRN
jgi:integration host factor subunit beta